MAKKLEYCLNTLPVMASGVGCLIAGTAIIIGSPFILAHFTYRKIRESYDEEYRINNKVRYSWVDAKFITWHVKHLVSYHGLETEQGESEAIDKHREALREAISLYSNRGDESSANKFRMLLNMHTNQKAVE